MTLADLEVDLAVVLAPFAGITLKPWAGVPRTNVALVRGDLVVWAGPFDRLELAPTDCRLMAVHPDNLAAVSAALSQAQP